MLIYNQTSDFTCGPSALMMVMAIVNSNYKANKLDEYLIWKEANTVHMADDGSKAGSSPQGLMLSASKRGYKTKLVLYRHDEMFSAWTNNEAQREIMKMIMEHDLLHAHKTDEVEMRDDATPITIDEVKNYIDSGYVPIVLTYEGEAAHWVCVQEYDENNFYVLNPWFEKDFKHDDKGRDIYSNDEMLFHMGINDKKPQALLLCS